MKPKLFYTLTLAFSILVLTGGYTYSQNSLEFAYDHKAQQFEKRYEQAEAPALNELDQVVIYSEVALQQELLSAEFRFEDQPNLVNLKKVAYDPIHETAKYGHKYVFPLHQNSSRYDYQLIKYHNEHEKYPEFASIEVKYGELAETKHGLGGQKETETPSTKTESLQAEDGYMSPHEFFKKTVDVGDGIKIDDNGDTVLTEYDNKENHAYLFFDQHLQPAFRIPTNIDSDDNITVYVMARSGQQDLYRLRDVEGPYKPEVIALEQPGANTNMLIQETGYKKKGYTLLRYDFSPVSSDYLKFSLERIATEDETIRRDIRLKINKLRRVGLGLSTFYTFLRDPEYQVEPIQGGGNAGYRLDRTDQKGRVMVGVNFIWYWDIFHKEFWEGDKISHGRDFFKTAQFIDRIYPSFGVAVNRDFHVNYNLGLLFEFAQGGSITAGAHLGRISRLDNDYDNGTNAIPASTDQLEYRKVWKARPYVGLMLDTRVLLRWLNKN